MIVHDMRITPEAILANYDDGCSLAEISNDIFRGVSQEQIRNDPDVCLRKRLSEPALRCVKIISITTPLARFLAGHSVSFCGNLGWNEVSNGDLLAEAEAAGFKLMITCDQNIKYQQNLSKRRILLIVLGSSKWKSVVARYTEEIIANVSAATPNSYVFIKMPSGRR